jgi:MFS family permease
MAIFFSAATAAGAFGGLLARGIVEMAGIDGRGGWAWIFIIEGIVTMIVGWYSGNRESLHGLHSLNIAALTVEQLFSDSSPCTIIRIPPSS